MRMSKPIIFFVFILYCLLLGSCSDNYKIATDYNDIFGGQTILGTIGIKIITYKKRDNFVIKNGNLEKVLTLVDPKKPSHQNPELISEGYDFLPPNNEYRYIGPQLLSPDGTTIVASCIRKRSSFHHSDSFVIIDNISKNIFYSESFDKKEKFKIEGVAWSPQSDAFLILASQSKQPFSKNILGYFTGHGVVSSDYYLFFYNKYGRLHVRKRFITSLINGNVKIVWTEQ